MASEESQKAEGCQTSRASVDRAELEVREADQLRNRYTDTPMGGSEGSEMANGERKWCPGLTDRSRGLDWRKGF